MDTTVLFSQFWSLPDNLKEEVADFVAFLSQKSANQSKTEYTQDENLVAKAMAVSEHSLREDWDTEDNANWEAFLKD